MPLFAHQIKLSKTFEDALGPAFFKIGIHQAVDTLCRMLPSRMQSHYIEGQNPIFNLMYFKGACQKEALTCRNQLSAARPNMPYEQFLTVSRRKRVCNDMVIKPKRLAPHEVARMREDLRKLEQVIRACDTILECTEYAHLQDTMFSIENTSSASDDLKEVKDLRRVAYARRTDDSGGRDGLEVYMLRLGQVNLAENRCKAYQLQHDVYMGSFFQTKGWNSDYWELITVSELCQKIDTCWRNSLEMRCSTEVNLLAHAVDDLFSQMITVGERWLYTDSYWLSTKRR